MSAPAAKKTSTRRKAGQSAIQKQYHELMEGRDISQAVRYKTSIRLAEGDMIDHKVFGIGNGHAPVER
ncbi:MAG: hypothetical protein R3C68_17900 [Myxococcota bacterium]